jgi:hypothetical protein
MTLSPHSTGNTFATLSPHSTANTEATLSPTSGSRRPQRRGGGSRLGSRFRGVTHHSRTARYESHLWDNGTFRFHHDDAPTTIFHTHHDLSTSPHRRQAGVPRRWVLISTDVRSLIARLDSLTRVTRSARSLVRSFVRQALTSRRRLRWRTTSPACRIGVRTPCSMGAGVWSRRSCSAVTPSPGRT